ncbi:MAG: hypothetical protein KF821_09350 [Anaerolineales bacterium]|nr:hypothetical protein [Anaerolineales bacterium]MBX3006013.1 hypothetical protein [Anaerolineales bacterium]
MKTEEKNHQTVKLTGYYTLLAAVIGGFSLILNTLIEQGYYFAAVILFIVLLIAIIFSTTRLSKFQIAKSIESISEALPSWKLLYEHDENGRQLKGSSKELIDAVNNAYPIKIKLQRPNERTEVMEAQWVFTENGIVHASNIDQISLGPDETGNYRYFAEPYHYFVIVNSAGFHHASRFFFNGELKSTSDGAPHMTWYGLVPPN